MTLRSHRATAILRGTVFAILLGALPACGGLPDPVYSIEDPVGSGSWIAIAGAPDWVETVPLRDGTFRFVMESRSNLRAVAISHRVAGMRRTGAARVHERLSPVLDPAAVDAVAAVAAETDAYTAIARACKEEVLTRDVTPGNTLCTAWTLCEVPIDTLVAPLHNDQRARAAGALGQ